MLAVVAAIAVALLLAVTGCGSGDQQPAADLSVDTGGRMQLPETAFDAGTVKTGTEIKHNFVIRNTGSGPLELGQLSVKRLEGC